MVTYMTCIGGDWLTVSGNPCEVYCDFGNPVFIEASRSLLDRNIHLNESEKHDIIQNLTNIAKSAVYSNFSEYKTEDQNNLACALIRAIRKADLLQIDPEWANSATRLAKRLEDVLWQEDVTANLFNLDKEAKNYFLSMLKSTQDKGIVKPDELENAMYLVLRYEQIKDERFVRESCGDYYEDLRSAM